MSGRRTIHSIDNTRPTTSLVEIPFGTTNSHPRTSLVEIRQQLEEPLPISAPLPNSDQTLPNSAPPLPPIVAPIVAPIILPGRPDPFYTPNTPASTPTPTLTPTPTPIDNKKYMYIAGGLIIAFFIFNSK